jgi:hypothetical protein
LKVLFVVYQVECGDDFSQSHDDGWVLDVRLVKHEASVPFNVDITFTKECLCRHLAVFFDVSDDESFEFLD